VRKIVAEDGVSYTCSYKLQVKGDLLVNKKSNIRCKPDKRTKSKHTETFIIGDKQVVLYHNVKKGLDNIVSYKVTDYVAPTTLPPPSENTGNMTCQCKPKAMGMQEVAAGRQLSTKYGSNRGSSASPQRLTSALTSLVGTFLIALITGFLASATANAVGRSVDVDMLAERDEEQAKIFQSLETNRQLFGGGLESLLGGGGSTSSLNEAMMEQMMNSLLSNPELMNSVINSAIESGAIEQAVMSAIENGVIENTLQSVIESGVIEQQLYEMANSVEIEAQINQFLESNVLEESMNNMMNNIDIESNINNMMEENSLMIEAAVQAMIEEQMNNIDPQMFEEMLGNLQNLELELQCSCA